MYYYEKLQATMEDTRTKPYNRLLDMVKKDYDGITEEIRARYARGTEARNRQEGFPDRENEITMWSRNQAAGL
jgi:hypothetical protein